MRLLLINLNPTIFANMLRLLCIYMTLLTSLAIGNEQRRLEGVKMLHEGKLQSAIEILQRVVDQEPNNYLANYNLATAHFANHNMERAKELFLKTLEIRSDFTDSVNHLVDIYTKQGFFQDALKWLSQLLSSNIGGSKRAKYIDMQNQLNKMQDLFIQTKQRLNSGKLDDQTENMLSQLIEKSDSSIHLFESRSELYSANGRYLHAIDDQKQILRLSPYSVSRTIVMLEIARLYIKQEMLDESIKWVRECLKIDREHDQCLPLFSKLKKLQQATIKITKAIEDEQYTTCVSLTDQKNLMNTKDADVDKMAESLLSAYHCRCSLHAIDDQNQVVRICSKALKLNENINPDVLKTRADAYCNLKEWDEALNDYQKLKDYGYSEVAEEGIRKVNQMKDRKGDDYYEILGVSRSASVQQINRAFRKKAKHYHPDGKSTAEEKAKADKMFKKLVLAKDVLTNKEKRELYDNGEDPNNPNAGRYPHGADPFGSFHFPGAGGDHFFGGSGFTFRFVYQ